MSNPSVATIVTGAKRCCAPTIVALLLLTACGQKGPLYLPGHSKDTPWPVPANPPAGIGAGQGPVVPATPGAAGGGAVAPTPNASTNESGASAKDGANASGGASSTTPEKPNNASQAPQ